MNLFALFSYQALGDADDKDLAGIFATLRDARSAADEHERRCKASGGYADGNVPIYGVEEYELGFLRTYETFPALRVLGKPVGLRTVGTVLGSGAFAGRTQTALGINTTSTSTKGRPCGRFLTIQPNVV